jgi:4-amino-4-deoxychorismate lyase
VLLAVLGPDGPRLTDPAAPLLRPDDLGVLRGESVFETARVAGGRVVFLDAHLARMARSAARVEVDLPAGWADAAELLLAQWPLPDGSLRLVCSKGGTAYALLTEIPETVVRERERGVRVVTLSLGVPAGLRVEAPWLLGGVKSTSYAVNMAALREAKTRGADDAVFTSTDGEVLEAPTSTVAWVSGSRLVTPPPAEVAILPGTTMDVVLRLCGDLSVPYEVRRGTVEELAAADEVLLCSSIRGVAPVVALDGQPRVPGPVSTRLREAFEAAVLT